MECVIRVTAQDIRDGIRRQPDKCPVARAIHQTLPGLGRIAVGGHGGVWFQRDGEDLKACARLLPFWVVAMIRVYDRTGVMLPFRFRFVY